LRQVQDADVALEEILFDARIRLLVQVAKVNLRGGFLELLDDLAGRESLLGPFLKGLVPDLFLGLSLRFLYEALEDDE
jgi:hypothetical protein